MPSLPCSGIHRESYSKFMPPPDTEWGGRTGARLLRQGAALLFGPLACFFLLDYLDWIAPEWYNKSAFWLWDVLQGFVAAFLGHSFAASVRRTQAPGQSRQLAPWVVAIVWAAALSELHRREVAAESATRHPPAWLVRIGACRYLVCEAASPYLLASKLAFPAAFGLLLAVESSLAPRGFAASPAASPTASPTLSPVVPGHPPSAVKWLFWTLAFLLHTLAVGSVWFLYALIRFSVRHEFFCYIYTGLLVCFSASKFAGKRVARQVDNLRSGGMPLELAAEIMVDCLYWSIFRDLIAFDVTSTAHFVFAKLLHVAMELAQSTLRTNDTYFRLTSRLLRRLTLPTLPTPSPQESPRLLGSVTSVVSSMTFLLFDHTAELEAWCRRCRLDMAVRFLVCGMTAAGVLVEFVALRGLVYIEEVRWQQCITYTVVSVLLEFATFALVICLARRGQGGAEASSSPVAPLLQMAQWCGAPFVRLFGLCLASYLMGTLIEWSRRTVQLQPAL